MKAVIQRVIHSNVKIDGEIVGKIGKGFMILLGVMQGDTKSDADKLIKKIPNLRIFGADMKVELINDGPVTIILDSEDLK